MENFYSLDTFFIFGWERPIFSKEIPVYFYRAGMKYCLGELQICGSHRRWFASELNWGALFVRKERERGEAVELYNLAGVAFILLLKE